MKKSLVFYLFLFILMVLAPLVGAYVGIASEKVAYEKKISNEQNEPWKQIVSPYSFTQIVDVNSHAIWAKVTDEKLYFWDFYCGAKIKCKEWIKTENVPDNAHDVGGAGELPMIKGTTCPKLFHTVQKEPPERVVECALGPFQTVVRIGTYYALLEDGTIWYWETPVPTDSPTTIYGAFFGFIKGIKVSIAIFIITFIFMTIQKNIFGKEKTRNYL